MLIFLPLQRFCPTFSNIKTNVSVDLLHQYCEKTLKSQHKFHPLFSLKIEQFNTNKKTGDFQ